MGIKGQRTTEEGQALLREPGIRKTVYDAQWKGADRLCAPETSGRTGLIQSLRLVWSSAAPLSLWWGGVCMRWKKECEVGEQPVVREQRQSREGGLSGLLEG